jgi:hypothetical protein
MAKAPVERSVQPDGTVRLHSGRCSFTFSRPRRGAVLVRITGFDSGALGGAPLAELAVFMAGEREPELFVDSSEADGASWDVSEKWTRFFRRNASVLKRVHILALSKFVHQTISVASCFRGPAS